MAQPNLLEELGLQGLPSDTQARLLTQMTESLLKRITLEVLEKLSPEERQEFESIRETADFEKVTEYLRGKIPDFDAMVREKVAEFKEEMKETIEALQQ